MEVPPRRPYDPNGIAPAALFIDKGGYLGCTVYAPQLIQARFARRSGTKRLQSSR